MSQVIPKLPRIPQDIDLDSFDFETVDTLFDVLEELSRARSYHKPFNSAHEGFAILKEEVDELWEEVRARQPRTSNNLAAIRKEAIQVAAMALRLVLDVCEKAVDR